MLENGSPLEMPNFSYTAKTKEGRRVSGQLQAQDLISAEKELETGHQVVYRLEEISKASSELKLLSTLAPVQLEDLVGFSQAIAAMSDGGISLKRTIDILLEDTEHATMRRLLSDISEDLGEGRTLSTSLSKHSSVFPSYYVAMTRAGEDSGNLPEMMKRLADIMTSVGSLEARAKAALSYPFLLFGFTLVSFLCFFAYGSPYLEGIYTSLGVNAPLATRMLLGLGVTLGHHKLALFLVLVGILYLAYSLPRREKSKRFFDRLRLNSPILGHVYRVLYTARFMRTLSILYRSGLGLARSLRLSAASIGNQVITEELFDLSLKLEQGQELSETLRESTHVSRLAVGMLAAAEECGKLETMLTRVADVYEVKSETLMHNARARMEPALMLCLGVAVAALLLVLGWPLIQLLSV